MITIKTVYLYDAWYTATAQIAGHYYHANEMTRMSALSSILRQIAVKGYIKM